MVIIEKATLENAERLTKIQTRTFDDDNKLKPPGCSIEGPPGHNSAFQLAVFSRAAHLNWRTRAGIILPATGPHRAAPSCTSSPPSGGGITGPAQRILDQIGLTEFATRLGNGRLASRF
jgi:hypothetical protein